MVVVEKNKGFPQIVLTPNRSANWIQTKHLLFVLAFTSLGIATAWSFMGAWVILPFAGFEVGLLAFLMHRVCFATYQQQVIRIREHDVFIQLGVYKPARGWRLNRESISIVVIEPNHIDDPVGLVLKDKNYSVELGAFLNTEDKQSVLDELKHHGLRTVKQGKTIQVAF
jgi:uncharacterized membrane protein